MLVHLKTVATIVGAVSAIFTGVDKVKTITQKWNAERKGKIEPQDEEDKVKGLPPVQ